MDVMDLVSVCGFCVSGCREPFTVLCKGIHASPALAKSVGLFSLVWGVTAAVSRLD